MSTKILKVMLCLVFKAKARKHCPLCLHTARWPCHSRDETRARQPHHVALRVCRRIIILKRNHFPLQLSIIDPGD